ncbi:MAG: hypothetical protein HY924_11945 [Elusimicrobia bacterium]|nr:hypothetical protein [Elusimicrobiota bacterium]
MNTDIRRTKSRRYRTAPIQYVFLDIVEYSKNRSVEAQTDIIRELNTLVSRSVRQAHRTSRGVTYLPTGDGICIAIMDSPRSFDVHLQIALSILNRIHRYNRAQRDPSRKFNVRIGINENTDNLISDINKRRNISGAGITIAQRVMGLADAGNILVGRSVYERLSQREKYLRSFRRFRTHIKHGLSIEAYQFINRHLNFLNCELPTVFRAKFRQASALTEEVAHLIANTASHRDFIAQHCGSGQQNYALRLLMIFLAQDSMSQAHSSAFHPPTSKRLNRGATSLADEYRYYKAIHFWVACDFVSMYSELNLKVYTDLFAHDYLEVTQKGLHWLRRDFPAIAKQFGLEGRLTRASAGRARHRQQKARGD